MLTVRLSIFKYKNFSAHPTASAQVGMEYVGYTDGSEKLLFRGDVASGEFIAFWVGDGQIRAGMNVNVWDVSETIRDLIRAGVEVDRDELTDPETDLASLLPA